MKGLIDVANQSSAEIKGIGIVIEKGFQKGGQFLRSEGYNLKSLAIVEEMKNGSVIFREN